MTIVDRFVQAVSHGGAMRPTLQVVHSAETPLRAGYAKSIAENWFGKSASTSAHFMVDPVELIRLLSDNVVSYAVGPKANGFTLNWEQAGYAKFSRAEWLTPAAGVPQMRRLAAGLRERGLANGIPLRWATDADIRAAAKGVPGGICFHDDIRRVLGGTTHTDPMPHYPKDELMALVLGGDEDDDMPLTDADIARIWEFKIGGTNARDRLQGVDGKTQDIGGQVWTSELNGVKARDRLIGVDSIQLPALAGQVAGLQAAITAIAQNPGSPVDLDGVFKAAFDGAAAAVAAGVDVDITVGGRAAGA